MQSCMHACTRAMPALASARLQCPKHNTATGALLAAHLCQRHLGGRSQVVGGVEQGHEVGHPHPARLPLGPAQQDAVDGARRVLRGVHQELEQRQLLAGEGLRHGCLNKAKVWAVTAVQR